MKQNKYKMKLLKFEVKKVVLSNIYGGKLTPISNGYVSTLCADGMDSYIESDV